MQLTVKANAKINWALDILGRREDGYHEMDMLMQSIDLADDLSFASSKITCLTVNDRPVANMEKNLIIKAVKALNDYTGEKRQVRINVVKRIPVRAGLGGGSADCAATLLALNDMWKLRLPVKTLSKIGVTLGADVPYCIAGGFMRVRGIGEILEEVKGAKEYVIAVHPVGEGLSTQAVFGNFDENNDGCLGFSMESVINAISGGDLRTAGNVSGNALERAAFRLMGEIPICIDKMYDMGAMYARMSGSGSAVYGVFENREDAEKVKKVFPGVFITKTLDMPSRL